MIILAGAPAPAKLDWSEKSLISEPMHLEGVVASPLSPTSKAFGAQWRQITTQRLQMRPILPKLNIDPRPTPSELTKGGADFFSADEYIGTQTPVSDISANESQPSGSGASASGGSADSTSEALSDYYEHSFTIHEAIPSNQLSGFSEYTPGRRPTRAMKKCSHKPQSTEAGSSGRPRSAGSARHRGPST